MSAIPLEEIAKKFHDATHSGVEGVKSNEEMLKDIFEHSDFEKRVKEAEKIKDWKKLGEGSSRTIFQISPSLILKIAHNEAGIAQNEAEMQMHSPCLNNILAADSEARWVITRFSETMTKKDFEEYTGFGFEVFFNAMAWEHNNEYHDKPRDYDEIILCPLYKCLSRLVRKHHLQVGDCAKVSSWGMVDDTPILRDFGLTKDIYFEHYKSTSTQSSSTSSSSSSSSI